jgi:hypothetical protein
MKNFLNKVLIWGGVFLAIYEGLSGEPIRLVPRQDTPVTSSPLPPITQESTSFWEGTPPSLVEAHFSKIPLHLTSFILQALRFLVLKENGNRLSGNTAFEKTKFFLLQDTGQLEEAQDFLLDTNFPERESLLLGLHWLKGDYTKTCEKIANLIRTSPDPEWKKQNVYCLYKSGEKERAKIALELLGESKPEDFSVLNALFDSASLPPFDAMIARSPFLLTVWGAIGHDIPEEVLNTLSPASLALVARTDGVPLKSRLLAGEKAFLEGTLESKDFLSLLSEAPMNNFLMKAEATFTALKPEEMLALCQTAFQQKRLGFLASLFKDLLVKIELLPENLPLAPYLIRAFLEANEKELAQKWATYFLREAPEEAIGVLPLLYLRFPEMKWGESQLQAYQAYQIRENPAQAAARSYCIRRTLEVLGEPQGQAMKGEPEPLSWRQESLLFEGDSLNLIEAAVKSGRKGEVLLFLLTLIGDRPLAELPCDKLICLLKALKEVGYPHEARSLALEFLLAKGY